ASRSSRTESCRRCRSRTPWSRTRRSDSRVCCRRPSAPRSRQGRWRPLRRWCCACLFSPPVAKSLFDFDVGHLDDGGVALLLAREEAAHLIGRARRRVEAQLHELLFRLRRGEDLVHLAGELLQDIARRASGRGIANPCGRVAATVSIVYVIWPLMMSVMAGAVPLYGTWRARMPAWWLKSSANR